MERRVNRISRSVASVLWMVGCVNICKNGGMRVVAEWEVRKGRKIPCVHLEFVCYGQLSLKAYNSVMSVRFDESSYEERGLLQGTKNE